MTTNAQVPQKMSYQAVVRNASNALLTNQQIGIRVSLLQDDSAGAAAYIEAHSVLTNINGLMTLQIGSGQKIYGNFESINWATGRYFVKTEIDPNGGSDFRIIGYAELLSVPYAFFASNQFDSISVFKKINIKLNSTDTLSMLDPYAKKANYISKADLDSTNKFDINLKGSIKVSKNLTVAGNIEAQGSTSSLGTVDKPFKGLYLSSGSLSIASDTPGQNIPAAVLSNVAGNLQISAGGLKLLNDAAFIAKNIEGELEGNASTATALKNTRKINGVDFDGTADIIIQGIDTSYLSNRINLKLPIADTSAMLSARFARDTSYLSNRINLKLPIADTSAMLSARFARDTSYLSNRINLKLPIADTSAMLSARFARDTSYLSNRINLKLPIADTSAMLSARFARDTSYLSNRINLKLNKIDTVFLSNRINSKMGLTGNQTLNGNLTVNEVSLNQITFPNGSVQVSAPHILTNLYEQGGDISNPTNLDLTISVHKLEKNYYFLDNGSEGQIIYFVPNAKSASASNIHVLIQNVRIWLNDDVSELSNQDWQPFIPQSPREITSPGGLNTIVTAIFTDGYWNISLGTLTPGS